MANAKKTRKDWLHYLNQSLPKLKEQNSKLVERVEAADNLNDVELEKLYKAVQGVFRRGEKDGIKNAKKLSDAISLIEKEINAIDNYNDYMLFNSLMRSIHDKLKEVKPRIIEDGIKFLTERKEELNRQYAEHAEKIDEQINSLLKEKVEEEKQEEKK